jgi:hypothetical protein
MKLQLIQLLCILLFFISSAISQNLQKKYSEAYSYFEKKNYQKADEICSKILEVNPGNVKDLNDIWYNHNAAYIMFFMYEDSLYTKSNKDKSKFYLELAKQYLDLLILKSPSLKEKTKPRYEVINNYLDLFDKTNVSQKSIADDKLYGSNERFSNGDENSIVQIVTIGEGTTLQLAVNNALINAIQEVLGVFINSKTIVNNDSLITEEFVQISSGNIHSYSVLSEIKDNNVYKVFVSSKVSPEKMAINFSTKTGYIFELNGGVYYQNILKEEFYKNQESKALRNFFEQWSSVNLFDYSIQELEMFRYVAHTTGEFWMPRVSTYLGTNSWNYYLSDIKKYENGTFYSLEQDEPGDTLWSYFPKDYLGQELFQIPYKISITPNNNYFSFIKSYAELLNALSIKNIENYQNKFGEPYIMWDLVYPSLLRSIAEKKSYTYPVSTDDYGNSRKNHKIYYGQIALRDPNSKKLLREINLWVKSQNICRTINITGIKGYTFPPAFLADWRYVSGGSKPYIDIEEFPYPHDGISFYSNVYVLLSFTKEELSKLNSKIAFSF